MKRILMVAVLAATLMAITPIAAFGSGAGFNQECLDEAIGQVEHDGDDHADGLVPVPAVEDCLEGSKSVILPPLEEVIVGTLFFIVVFLVLAKYAFPAMKKTLKGREQKIRDDLEAAEKEKNDAIESRKAIEDRLAKADEEARKIIALAREQADQARADILAKAEVEAGHIRDRANEDAQAAGIRATIELKSNLAEATVSIAEKIVGRSLDAAAQQDLIDNYITEVGSSN